MKSSGLKCPSTFLKPDDIGWFVNYVVEFIHDITIANAHEKFKKTDDHTMFFHLVLQIQKRSQAVEEANAICLPKVIQEIPAFHDFWYRQGNTKLGDHKF